MLLNNIRLLASSLVKQIPSGSVRSSLKKTNYHYKNFAKSIMTMTSNSKYFETGTNLLDKPTDEVKEWLNSFDTVLCDCDGVLWFYNEAIPGSSNVINKFKDLNKKVYFVTNNSTKTRSEFLEKAIKLDFHMKSDEIISTSYATAMYLKNRNFSKKVYIIGSNGIAKELDGVGIKHFGVGPDVVQGSLQHFLSNPSIHVGDKNDIGAVIVGFDEHFSFPKMAKAASFLNDKSCLFIATNTDESFPLGDHVIPGTGSFVRAIETCTERLATIIGKPNARMCEHLIKNNIIVPERTLMIGDRCNTDILFGKNCGFQTMLVGTGIQTLCDVEKWKKNGNENEKRLIPDVFLPKLGDLMQYL